tara:strand:- start:47 stop:382 length:336 start_codon:yes stop_codon:yes gene_type:complete
MIVVEQSDNRGVLYSTITRKGYHIMIPVVAAGTMGLRILKTLYKGKKKIGSATKMAADKAGKAGFTGTSKAITGASKKIHSGSRKVGKFIKKNPKTSSFAGGAATISFLDD